jgi:exonuclease SbcC
MRLHRLALTGIGPFLRRQEIDFDDLAGSGLFLIDGPTGAGKTTIIDAIVYALYGDVSGGSDSDGTRIRSSYCTDTDPSGVTLEFSVDGRRHRVSRIPAGARDPEEPGRAASSKPARQVLTEIGDDGSPRVVLTRDREIREHVQELLDMTSEQFRQLVVLPQGKFADLLRMTPTDRLNSLASLLDHRDLFQRVQDDLKEQGVRAEEDRRAARLAVSTAAQQLAGRLRSHIESIDPAPATDFTSPDASDEDRSDAVEAILAGLAGDLISATSTRDAHRVAASALARTAEQARTIATTLAEVGDAQRAVADAERAVAPEDSGLAVAQIPTRIGDLRVQEGSLGELAAWEAQAPARAAEREQLAARAATSIEAAAVLRAERDALPGQRTAQEAQRSAAQLLAGSLAAVAREEERLSTLVDKAEELGRRSGELALLDADLRSAESESATATATSTAAHEAWLELIDRQRSDQAAALASTLASGEACPVCGSLEHPQPAHPSGSTSLVTDAQIAIAKEGAAASQKAAGTAADVAAAARSARDACARVVTGLEGALDGISLVQLPDDMARARQAHHAAAEAADSLAGLEDQLAGLQRREAELEDEIASLDKAAALAEGALSERDESEQREQQRIRAAIGDAPSAGALLSATRARISLLTAVNEAHDRLAAAASAVPATHLSTTVEEAAAAADRAEEASLAGNTVLADAETTVSTIASTIADARPMAQDFSISMARRRAVDQSTAAAYSLAQLASGRNNRSLPLRSYALQRRFESVLAASSVHLERMSSGKFSFELNEETARGQSGLGISLHDAWTGHRQDPKSLSGGETFYAALSLALGLADVVRGEAGGSALETLFIDEGFGSLDQATLYQVLDQLDELRSGRRVVGVISHVTEMKESIPDRIEVKRGDDSTSSVTRPSGAST